MKIRNLIVSLILLALALIAAPAVHADCDDEPGPGVDWSGCDKYGASLDGLNLSGADLTGTNLTNSFLNGTNLSGAKIERMDISFATAVDTNFSGARGIPITLMTFFTNVTCPDGTPGQNSCGWNPVAINLLGLNAMTMPNYLPLVLFIALGLISTGMILGWRRGSTTMRN